MKGPDGAHRPTPVATHLRARSGHTRARVCPPSSLSSLSPRAIWRWAALDRGTFGVGFPFFACFFGFIPLLPVDVLGDPLAGAAGGVWFGG